MYKNPIKEKLFEALSVLADDRIDYTGERSAKVFSSDRSKFYTLAWSEGFSSFYSDDNASKWQGTLGYPIVAVLLDREVLSPAPVPASKLSDVNSNSVNKQFKRDYAAAADSVMSERVTEEEASLLKEWASSGINEIGALGIKKAKKSDIT